MKDTGDFHHDFFDANILAYRIDALGKQAICDGGANHDDLADFIEIEGIRLAPQIEGHIVFHFEVFVRDTVDIGTRVLALEGNVAIALRGVTGNDADSLDLLADGLKVRDEPDVRPNPKLDTPRGSTVNTMMNRALGTNRSSRVCMPRPREQQNR